MEGTFCKNIAPTPFPIGLIKSESDIIVRSVETGLGRWAVVVAVISVDAYLLLAFSEIFLRIHE